MITKRNAIWLVPALLLITFPLWKIPVADYLSPRGGYDVGFSKKQEIDYNFFLEGVTINQVENGKQAANISAKRAQSTDIPSQYILTEIAADIIDKKGTTHNIVADEGIYNQQEEKLQLIDNVTITNTTEKFSLSTSRLFYDGKKGILYSPTHTEISGDGITMKGSSFDHDMNTGTYEVGGRVHCTIEAEKVSR